MSFVRPAWLTARPIAHRGLHVRDKDSIENSASAARAAIARGFAIECDAQASADGEAMVFHDFTLDRLTEASGAINTLAARDLAKIKLKGSADTIMSLRDLLRLIGGATPLVCEIKSRFDGDLRLAESAARAVAEYEGPVALKSFDPRIIAHLQDRRAALGLGGTPLGVIAQAAYDDPRDEWAGLPGVEKQALAQFLHFNVTRPDFLSWGVRDLPHATPFLCRQGLGMPVMTWTVRDAAQAAIAARWADQIIFEGDGAP